MKKNLFEMGADLGEGWTADNKSKEIKEAETGVKTPEQHRLYLAKEKRRGKAVTIVKPFHLSRPDLQALLKKLKKKLGCGGTLKEDSLELQGDIPDQVRRYLTELGYRFRS